MIRYLDHLKFNEIALNSHIKSMTRKVNTLMGNQTMYSQKKPIIRINSKNLEKMSSDPTLSIIKIIQKLSVIRQFKFKNQNDLNKFVIDKFYDKLFIEDMDEQEVKNELHKVRGYTHSHSAHPSQLMALSREKINTHKKFGQSQHGFKLDEGKTDPKEAELDFVRNYTYE